MNEWGVPDWRSDVYFSWKMDIPRWRWEFLRRHPEYREDFDKARTAKFQREYDDWSHAANIAETEPSRVEVFEGHRCVTLPNGERFWFIGQPPQMPVYPKDDVIDAVNDKYSTNTWPNPRTNSHDYGIIAQTSPWLKSRSQFFRDKQAVKIRDNTLVLEIDLSDPLTSILKFADHEIRTWIKKEGRRKPKNPRLWQYYLRVLDARNAGETWSSISDLLPDSKSSRTPQDARDFHKQATRLCFEL